MVAPVELVSEPLLSIFHGAGGNWVGVHLLLRKWMSVTEALAARRVDFQGR